MTERKGTAPKPIFDRTAPAGQPSPLDPFAGGSYKHHDKRPRMMPGKRKPSSSK